MNFQKYKILKSGKNKGRIQALRSFNDVVKGDIGGFVDQERNLSQDGDSWVYGNGLVYENGQVYGDSQVYENSQVIGNSQVFGDSQVHEGFYLYGNVYTTPNITIKLLTSLGVCSNKGKYILYKSVNEDLSSAHDENFKYKLGKIAKADSPDLDTRRGCSSGLHCTSLHLGLSYFSFQNKKKIIEVEVNEEDIICVLENKVRCKKLKVLREIKL